VRWLQTHYDVSQRRACGVMQITTASFHYRHRRPDQAFLKMRLKELAASCVRYGYRRLHVLLKREGWEINAKRVYRFVLKEPKNGSAGREFGILTWPHSAF